MVAPPEIDPDKVAVYIRWSTDDQGEGTTLETQLERCQHYLRSQGWRFQGDLLYIDDGHSGGSLDRPALTRLRADVAQSKVHCVVAYKIDRLSRSVVDIVDLVLKEWEGRCFVKSTTEEVNTLTPAGKIFFYLLVSFAEYERNLIRERTMSGKIKRAEQGLNPGFRLPYGYRKGPTPGAIQLIDHEATVVRRIFDLYMKGDGPCRIADLLNSDGATRRGERWSDLAIRRLLANPAYSGVLAYGRSMRFAAPLLARFAGAFPAVVDQPTWDRVQQLLQSRSTKHRAPATKPTYSEYLLSGLAACRCGAPISGKRAGGHRYYCCSARKRQGRSACDAGHIPTLGVDALLADRVKAILLQANRATLATAIQTRLAARLGEISAEIAAEIAGQEATLGALAVRRHRLERDYRNGDLPAKLYTPETERAVQEESACAARIEALRQRREAWAAIGCDKVALAVAVDPADAWDEMTVPEQKQLLRMVTTSIRLYRQAHAPQPPTVEIDWLDGEPLYRKVQVGRPPAEVHLIERWVQDERRAQEASEHIASLGEHIALKRLCEAVSRGPGG